MVACEQRNRLRFCHGASGHPSITRTDLTRMRVQTISFFFHDGAAALLIVEGAELVLWTKPTDLPFDRKRPLPALGWSFRQDFRAALADGSIRIINRQLSEGALRAAITRNGGETLGPDW
jgi:hypothetical protein